MSALQFIKTTTKKRRAERNKQNSLASQVQLYLVFCYFVFIQYICLHWFYKIRFWIVIFSFPGIQEILEVIICLANHVQKIITILVQLLIWSLQLLKFVLLKFTNNFRKQLEKEISFRDVAFNLLNVLFVNQKRF